MKFASIAVVLTTVSPAVQGFLTPVVVPHSTATTSTTRLFSSRVDTSNAIQAAIEASRTYGAHSPEARLAWEAVEEMDSADNSVAFEKSTEEECMIEEQISQACVEYGQKLDELHHYVTDVYPKMKQFEENVASDIKAIKMKAAKVQPAPDSPQLRAAMDAARSATKQYGATSPEARVAWDTVEEIASSGLSNAMGGRLDEECYIDSAMEACEALEELNRALSDRGSKKNDEADAASTQPVASANPVTKFWNNLTTMFGDRNY